ncbi:MAG TPA: AI-2E family transporter [Burkholderiales bacterium]|jgi:predicted PurR-regulated permease PerM|nr:AI-2E family transporter [Burkholderiales bacterium]
MPLRSEQLQTLMWAALGLAFLVLIYFLSPILTPFLAGAIFAYILNPGVNWLERKKVPRVIGAALMVTAVLVGVLLAFLIVAPLVTKQVHQLSQNLPGLLSKLDQLVSPRLHDWFGWEVQFDADSIKNYIAEHWESNDGMSARILASLRLGGLALAGIVGNLVLIPLVLFYLLEDWPLLISSIDNAVPRRWHAQVGDIAREIDSVLAEFLRGQTAVMGLLILYYSIALWIGGLDFALPIGLITGGLVFVPYLGFGTGLTVALLVALLQGNVTHALIVVAVVFGVGQVLESFILTPKIVGKRIGLHPLAVVFALLAFGQVFGFFGVLLALPASAILLVGLRRLTAFYLASPFYTK